MYGTFDITYQGTTGSSVGVYAVKRPSIPAPQKRVDKETVPGRNGSLFIEDGAFEDLTFDLELNFHAADTQLGAKFRAIKEWLLKDGNRRLSFSDDSDVFYIVKRIEMRTANRTAPQIYRQTVRITVDPFQYLASGLTEINPGTISNPCWVEAHPIYTITGNGQKTLTVNGNTFTANVTTKMTIDTERMIALGNDGQNQSSLVSGNYEDLYLKPGSNTVAINSGTLKITPNWRTP